ncbi:MAG: pentapeptide repeat-containing protein [Cyclobacteriaceae bacterium]|nr:pentapeptide repeat-containing protein [Cyclobacteriaceae bacterium]
MRTKITFSEKFRKFFDHILEEPVMISFLVLLTLSMIIIGMSLPFYFAETHNFLLNILAEAHGMIFDIAVIGILIFWLNQVGQKKLRIRSYRDEIEDFRLWESEEAAFRTVGNIKRLNRHKIFNIDLVNCYLVKTNLNYVILKEANMNNANVSNSFLIQTNLEGARLNRTNFENSNLNQVNLKGAYASGANFRDAYLIKANLFKAYLIKTDFNNAFLMESDLRGANLTGANFDHANLYKTDFRGAYGLTIKQFQKVKTLYLAKFDPEFQKKLERVYPDLVVK